MSRTFDAGAAAVGLFILAPLMAVIAALVKLTSRGPAIFVQERIGQGGHPFRMLKFRTMTNGFPKQGPLLTTEGDKRITQLGQVLRSSKLDELPQLINVVRGDMSLVGPRPEVPEYVAHWNPAHRETVLSVRPGITDPATVHFRSESVVLANQDDPESYYLTKILPMKVEMYVQYVNTKTFRGDLKILQETMRAL